MKMSRYDDYQPLGTERCEQALLTVWACLRDYAEHLVLIGGLVPRYLCVQRSTGYTAQTLDVDLGIALAADACRYDPISARLRSHDFEPKGGAGRFVRKVGHAEVILDFLTEKNAETDPGIRMVDDVRTPSLLGIDRALAHARCVAVSGSDLQGAKVTEQIRICEVGPFLCLKLAAYAARAEGKDVFDVVRCVVDYQQGPEAALADFAGERGINKAYGTAQAILTERFQTPEAKGPVDYANFCLSGHLARQSNEDQVRLTNELRNEAWLLGQRLLGR